MHEIRGLTRRSVLAGGAATLLATSGARAQSFPTGPVKIINSVGSGGAPDVVTRVVAEHLGRHWGQQVIVLNQPGGAGAVAIKALAAAPADGHTLYASLASNFIALPELQKNFPLDVLRDLVPVGFIGDQPLIIAAAPSLGVNTLPEFIELLKQKPGQFNIGGGSRGSILHLTGEWIRSATKTKFTLVHYPGGARALPDLIGGRIQATIDAMPSMRGAIEGGQVKALAVTTRTRVTDVFPQVATVSETIPNFYSSGWMALMAPPGTPEPLAQKISADLRAVLVKPEVKKRLDEIGNYIRPGTPEDLRAFIQEQQQTWGPIIAETVKSIR